MADSYTRIPNQPKQKYNFVVYSRDKYLYLTLPQSLGYKRSTKVSLNMTDSPDNVDEALEIAQRMRRDVINGCYVKDINHYFPFRPKKNTSQETSEQLTVTVIHGWNKYIDNVLPYRKPNTHKYLMKTINPVMANIGNHALSDGQGVYDTLKKWTSTDMIVRVLGYLKRIVNDYYPYMVINGNPYDSVLREARRNNKKIGKTLAAKVISDNELDEILGIIKDKWECYYYFVKFIALTGCRPSEAVGLRWKFVSDTEIKLGHGLTKLNREWVISEGSKNNTLRSFPVSLALYNLINEIPRRKNPLDLVFLTTRGKPIDLCNFNKNVWRQVTANYTLYNLRDTFITKQVENNTPLAIIGQWCDNSETVIQKHYLGKSTKFLPV